MRCVCFLLLLTLGSACAPTWESAVRDYQLGRYRAAEKALLWYAQKGSGGRKQQAERILSALNDERARAIDFLLAEAKHVRKLADAQQTSYGAVDAFLEAALELMPPTDGRRPEIEEQRRALVRQAEERRAAYLEHMSGFGREVTRAGRCRGAEWITAAQRLSTEREGAGIPASRDLLVLYTAEAANKCFELRAYEAAVALSDLAEALRHPASDGSAAVARLSAVVQARLFTEEPAVAGDVEADLSAEEVETLAEAPLERALAEAKPKRRRRSRPKRKAATETSPDASGAPSTALERREVEGRITSLISRGSKFEALVLLQALLDENPNTPWLESLRARYGDDRERLVEEYLSLGESALQREKPDLAFSHYQRVLSIDPGNEIANDRTRKIENLRKLRQRQQRSGPAER